MNGEVVVVTGGAGALGAALARGLARKGARVALVGRGSSTGRLAGLRDELGEGVATVHTLDGEGIGGWRATVDGVSRELGAIGGAVLAAGGWAGGAKLHDGGDDDDVYRRMMGDNADSAYFAMRALVPSMARVGRGSVVAIGSRAAVAPATSAGAAEYAMAKAAVTALVQVVAAEVKERGVRVNAVLPSTLDTPANRAAMPSADASRWVSLEAATELVAFLLSDASRDVSGALIPLYGRA